MVRVKDILCIDFKDVFDAMIKVRPEQVNNAEGYKNVYDKLKTLEPSTTDMELRASIGDEDGTYFNVVGKGEDGHCYALEFTPWCEWISMPISVDTLTNMTAPEILAACLYEMTFIGFEEDDIRDEYLSLEETFKKMKDDFSK